MKLTHVRILSLLILFISCSAEARGEKSMERSDGLYANIKTNKGDILVRLEWEKTPLTVLNFVGLAKGILNAKTKTGNFYDKTIFHRVVPNFVIQGGDPTGTGTGGPGYFFPDEIHPDLRHNRQGVVSMANSGPNSNGSQFFITLEAAPWLDGKHAIFGEVIEGGMEVVKKISQGDSIECVEIIIKGKQAENFEISQSHFDSLVHESWINQKKVQEESLSKERKIALSRFKDKNKVKESKDGVLYEIENKGTKVTPKDGQTLEVHYTGHLLNGKKFDSSYDRGKTFKFILGKDHLIPGWESQLKEMKVGEKRHILIPPHLAYAERGIPGVIPPNSFLDFTIKLISSK